MKLVVIITSGSIRSDIIIGGWHAAVLSRAWGARNTRIALTNVIRWGGALGRANDGRGGLGLSGGIFCEGRGSEARGGGQDQRC